MKYDGEDVDLTPEQEEIASHFAKYLENETHMKKKQFSKNFFHGFKKILGKKHTIQEYSKCDFTPILNHLKEQSELRKNRTKDEKKGEKELKEEMRKKYGFCYN